jgi:hypothetical protein
MITKNRNEKSPKKYFCKKCYYHSRNKFDYDKHLTTAKHKITPSNFVVAPPTIYTCQKCLYHSSNKFDFDKHLTTTKHQMVTNGNKKSQKIATLTCDCGKIYKFKSGLSRHQKKCKCKKQVIANTNPTNELLTEMKKQREQTEELIKICRDRQQIISYQNCGNKKMTINIFLNEKCKDAMNLTNFVENLEVSLKDLEYTNEHGYVKGISNIITKHLTGMKPTERPIHCCDRKRLQFYVKDEDRWEKDDKNIKIDQSIQEVTFKQIKKLKEWEEVHPGYLEDDKLLLEWHSMLRGTLGDIQDDDKQKNKEEIKKQISENIELRDAMKD